MPRTTDTPKPKPIRVEMCDIKIRVTAKRYKALEKAAKLEKQTVVQYVTALVEDEADNV